jgi:hypothetical protein
MAQPAAADDKSQAFKLEGAWVATVVGVPMQWSYVVSPDPSGRRASGHGSIEVGVVLPEPFTSDFTSPLLVEMVMKGPDKAVFNSIWYGLKRTPEGPLNTEITFIGMNQGEIRYVEPGKAVGTHHLEIYHPSQDTDGDGFPDPGQTPQVVFDESTTMETRLPLPN